MNRAENGPLDQAQPAIAVVVMAHRAPPALRAAVSSILAEGEAVELLVVNSGGGDPLSLLSDLVPPSKVLNFKKRLWAGAARNRGIKATSSPYVAFLAADCVVSGPWLKARLARHRAGAAAVATAVLGSDDRSMAWAAHMTLFGRRHPALPENMAIRYGASYDRRLFDLYGLFREDLRIGEDTEFHARLEKIHLPVWAPEVVTVHQSPVRFIDALRDQFRRGHRSGKYWPSRHAEPIAGRVWKRLAGLRQVVEAIESRPRPLPILSLPLIALCITSFELGAHAGRKKPVSLVQTEAEAKKALSGKNWRLALKLYKKLTSASPGIPAFRLGHAQALRATRRYKLAIKEYESLLASTPSLLAAHKGLALCHEKLADWERALDSWHDLCDLAPASVPYHLGKVKCLVKLGRYGEAQEACIRAVAAAPDDKQATRELARVSMLVGDNKQALRSLSRLWTDHGDGDAVLQQIKLLTKLGDYFSAAQRLEECRNDLNPQTTLSCELALVAARQDWDRLRAIVRKEEVRILESRRLLAECASLLTASGNPEAGLQLIRRSEPGKLRDRYELNALIRCKRYSEVWQKFGEKASSGKMGSIPASWASALIMASYEAEGHGAAQRCLEALAKQSLNVRDGLATGVSLPFHQRRLDWLVALENGADLKEVPLEQLVRDWTRDHVYNASATSYLLEQAEIFSQLRRAPGSFYPDPCYSFSDAEAVAARLIEAIRSKSPLSLVRLGDGEGNYLPYRTEFEDYASSDRARTRHTWWGAGEDAGDNEAAELRDLLGAAIASADVIGVPDLFRLSRILMADSPLSPTQNGKSARGLIAALDAAIAGNRRHGDDLRRHPLVTSCHIHQALCFWDLWQRILGEVSSVSVVTCHPQLPSALRRRFGVGTRQLHLVPAERKYASLFDSAATERHFPDAFERLKVELARTPRGEVVLVAAGVLGKAYCTAIRDAGGIGIDIGSAADYWCGFSTRGFEESLAFHSGPRSRQGEGSPAGAI